MRKPVIPFVVNLALEWTFFGLTPKYKVQKQEQIFDLIFHSNGAFSYNEVYNMPVYLRIFYIRRLEKFFKDKQKRRIATKRDDQDLCEFDATECYLAFCVVRIWKALFKPIV